MRGKAWTRLLFLDERPGCAFSPRSSGSADAVHVFPHVEGDIIGNDVLDGG